MGPLGLCLSVCQRACVSCFVECRCRGAGLQGGWSSSTAAPPNNGMWWLASVVARPVPPSPNPPQPCHSNSCPPHAVLLRALVDPFTRRGCNAAAAGWGARQHSGRLLELGHPRRGDLRAEEAVKGYGGDAVAQVVVVVVVLEVVVLEVEHAVADEARQGLHREEVERVVEHVVAHVAEEGHAEEVVEEVQRHGEEDGANDPM